MKSVQIAEDHEDMCCPKKNRLETEGNEVVPSVSPLQRVEEIGAENLLVRVLDRDNLNRAYKRVKKNRSAPDLDGIDSERDVSISYEI